MSIILDSNPTTTMNGQIILVEKCKENDNIIPDEIKKLFQDYQPFEIKHFNSKETLGENISSQTLAKLIFPTTEQAEKLFAMFVSDNRIQLRYDFSQTFLLRYNKNFATCYIQEIPIEYNLQVIYSIFRKFGPVYKCQRLTASSKIVMIHYYSIKHREQAMEVMNNFILPGDIQISVVCSSSSIGIGSKKKRSTNLKLQPTTINNKNTSLLPSSSSITTSPNTVVMNHSPSQPYFQRYDDQQQQQQRQQQQQESYQAPKIKLKQPAFEIKPTMDLCNLYIKGIQPGLTSASLFNLFKPFGRIISAKVMEDNTSGSQTGFGFVSYSSSTEAAKALIEMNCEESSTQPNKISSKVSNMVVRFHEPRVPRLEHNYNQQLSLLSYSPFSCHFYTRKNQKIVPLQPTIEPSTSYFPNTAVNHHHPYYYYPSYWTHQGIVYTNFIGPVPPSTGHYYYNEKKVNQQRHSWNGTLPLKNNTETISNKLIQVLKKEYKITELENPELFKKVLQLNRTEQSNCLNNSIYFKKKISHFMNNE